MSNFVARARGGDLLLQEAEHGCAGFQVAGQPSVAADDLGNLGT